MPARTTIELPESLHERLVERSRRTGSSIPSLIVRALELTYAQINVEPEVKVPFPGPMITGTGKRGPLYPVDENPHDLVFS